MIFVMKNVHGFFSKPLNLRRFQFEDRKSIHYLDFSIDLEYRRLFRLSQGFEAAGDLNEFASIEAGSMTKDRDLVDRSSTAMES